MSKSTYIALGSNLGNQEENLRLAATELQKISTSSLVASSIWWSTPEGFDENVAAFCNASASCQQLGKVLVVFVFCQFSFAHRLGKITELRQDERQRIQSTLRIVRNS